MAPQPLRAAVGIRYGKTQVANQARDQVEVAEMLRAISTAEGGRKEVWDLSPLVSERVCGPDLYKAINDFQIFWRSKGQFRVVDGVVDPGGTTYRKMYALAMHFPPFPNEPDAPVVPPPGVAPTPADLASILFEPPLYIGVGIKLSMADPLIFGSVAGVFSTMGIPIPHGCDLLFAGVRPIRKPEPIDSLPFAGLLLGVTPRNGMAGYLTVDKALAIARAQGADPRVIKILETISHEIGRLPTSIALAAGVTAVMAKGFANVGQMHGYRSSGGDEIAFNVAVGGNLKSFLKWLAKGAEIANLGLQGWAIIDTARKLAADKSKALASIDIPGLGYGIDIGVSKGTTVWYSLNVAGLVSRLTGLRGA